jgi:uncharacterized protein (DUF1330 family)
MAAYVVVQAEVNDWDKFRQYLRESPGVIARFGGRYLARGETIILEGAGEAKRMVIIEFASLQKAEEWYHSEEYQQIRLLRLGAATGSLVAIGGC